MNDEFMNVPKEAAENPSADIEFCGQVFKFREPKARDCYKLLGRALKLIGLTEIVSMIDDDGQIDVAKIGGTDLESAALRSTGGQIQYLPDVFDFVCDALEIAPLKRQKIEQDFFKPEAFREIMEAFQKIMEKLQRPFVGGITNSDPAKKGE